MPWSGSASAWDDAPLCALEPPPPLLSLASAAPLEPAPPMCRTITQPLRRRDLNDARARDAWARATSDDDDAALLALDTVAHALPRLVDLVELRRGEILFARAEAGDATALPRARQAFERATESVDAATRLRAQVGAVRVALLADRRDAADALARLLRQHPELPEEPDLLLLDARRLEARGAREALGAYRTLDVRFPGSRAGREARRRLLALDEALSDTQRVERAERLVRHGPLDEAREELARLESERLHPSLAARVHGLLGRLARHEGRWTDAERHLSLARTGAPEDAVDAERALDMAAAARAREESVARAELRRLGYREALAQRRRVRTARLFAQLRASSRAALIPETNALVAELDERSLPPGLRLDAALTAVGVADDEGIVRLLGPVVERAGSIGTRAAYHRARALERLGRLDEAEAAFHDVRARDRGWYALWAEQRLGAVRAAMQVTPAVGAVPMGPRSAPLLAMVGAAPYLRAVPVRPTNAWSTSAGATGAAPLDSVTSLQLADATRAGTSEEPNHHLVAPATLEGAVDSTTLGPQPAPRQVDFEVLVSRLSPIVEAHGDAYPWLGRAEDLLRLGDAEAAGRQLYEAFLAWREATGRAIRRSGLPSVARGAERSRRFVPFSLKAARRRLDARARAELIAVAEAVGDYGAATGFGGISAIEALPRAYEPEVEAAARRHGLDPNLLFAVMRVESVYQKEIVSYAGAIGLCQIMPRTGALIASAKGDTEYTAAWLLDPEVNLDYAAWYLRSLLERFDGHLPLAIASYNGGPHNVRRWLRDRVPSMPMEAFLEHIPFSQTHRYVRRVLVYYAAYRAQQGLPMIALSVDLPQLDADRVGF